MADCPGADGLVCLNGWLYSSVGGMVFPANKKCSTCNEEKKKVADNRCQHEGCEKFALLGKDYCYDHAPGREVEVEVEEEEIPQRFLDRDPNPENWRRYTLPDEPRLGEHVESGQYVRVTQYLECVYCACMVHEDSAKWHARYHISLNNNIGAIYRALQNRG